MSHSSYNQNHVAGAILAGGRSRRMGTGNKALQLLVGKAMVAHVIDRLKPQVGALVINANGDAGTYAPFRLPVVADIYGDYAGPLAGLLTAMRWAEANCPQARWVVTAACDTPFIPNNYVEMLANAALASPGAIALAASSGGTHYVLGLWPLELADDLAAWLAKGERKVQLWVERHPHIAVTFPDAETGGQRTDPFFNANTPDDLATAARLIEEHAPVTPSQVKPPLFGITGWKNSGKTTLTARLVAELAKEGYKVATVKHAHHEFDVDQPGRDSYRFREAGAREVAVVSSLRVAIMHELRGEAEPALADVVERLGGSDIVLAEGFKTESHPKIEVRRRDAKDTTPLAGNVPNVVAIASDHPTETNGLPLFDIDDIGGMADFIIRYTSLDVRP